MLATLSIRGDEGPLTLAQTPGVTQRCEMYSVGSRPDESPISRVGRWRDEEPAQAQAAARGKYTKVVMTTFELK